MIEIAIKKDRASQTAVDHGHFRPAAAATYHMSNCKRLHMREAGLQGPSKQAVLARPSRTASEACMQALHLKLSPSVKTFPGESRLTHSSHNIYKLQPQRSQKAWMATSNLP